MDAPYFKLSNLKFQTNAPTIQKKLAGETPASKILYQIKTKLNDQHSIAIAEESIFIFNRFFIGIHH